MKSTKQVLTGSAVVLLFILVVVPGALAWNATGHKVVAAIAWQSLTSDEQDAVFEILKDHPKFPVWDAAHEPAGSGSLTLALHAFMESSIWPDQIRNKFKPETHPNWHFIDYPLKPNAFAFKKAPTPLDDIVFGITTSHDTLVDDHMSKVAQAEALSFLVHLMGDIHQPLHCSTLFNSTFKLPDGDRGGNNFMVKMQATSAKPVKLHTLWDSLLGTGTNEARLLTAGAAIIQDHPRTQFPAAAFASSIVDVSKEIRLLAINSAYKPLPALNGTTNNPVTLPNNYHLNARILGTNQVALAGYRLADMIKGILAERADNP